MDMTDAGQAVQIAERLGWDVDADVRAGIVLRSPQSSDDYFFLDNSRDLLAFCFVVEEGLTEEQRSQYIAILERPYRFGIDTLWALAHAPVAVRLEALGRVVGLTTQETDHD